MGEAQRITDAPERDGASELFAVERLSRATIAAHTAGGVANCAAIALTLAVLARWHAVLANWWLVLAALVLGAFIADFVTGIMHWAFDTFFSEHTAVARMVIRVREHHVYPDRIFRYGFFEDGGLLAIFGALAAAPFLALALWATPLPIELRAGAAILALSLSLEIMFMGELHKCGHRRERGPLLRGLQRAHLVLSPDHHLRHHAGDHTTDYCLVNGWADDTLGRLGAFRVLERAVVLVAPRLTPRANDLSWQERATLGGALDG